MFGQNLGKMTSPPPLSAVAQPSLSANVFYGQPLINFITWIL